MTPEPQTKSRARRTEPQATPLIWVGGKVRVLPAIHGLLDELGWLKSGPFDIAEPFMGSSVLSLGLLHGPEASRPRTVFLGDAVEPLLCSFRTMHRSPSAVIDSLRGLRASVGGDLTRGSFEAIRAVLNERVGTCAEKEDPLLTAAFLVVNWAGFNGIWRTNQNGLCNVPWGKWAFATEWSVLEAQIERTSLDLRRAERLILKQWDARAQGITPLDLWLVERGVNAPPVFIYVDSPYPGGGYTGYAGKSWQRPDFLNLREHLIRWHMLGARILISFPAGHDDLLPPWPFRYTDVPNLVGQTPESRNVRSEVLMYSP